MSILVFVPAVFDLVGSTFKNNCVKSSKRQRILSVAVIQGNDSRF